MYTITSAVFIHFGHHVRGHDGPCISLHGHTWKFEVSVQAADLDERGFVIDFDLLQDSVLMPCHALLDHSLAVGVATWKETSQQLAALGEKLVSSRVGTLGGLGEAQPQLDGELLGARNERPGGIKVAVFPFTPTSERLARWLFDVADKAVGDGRRRIAQARVFESMQPTEQVAEYKPA